jgi:hypothetical protein
MLSLDPETLGRLYDLLMAETYNFLELVQLGGFDSATSFIGADLQRVDFGEADLTGFCFHKADLRGANFGKVIGGLAVEMLTDSVWDGATTFPDGFDPKAGWGDTTP